MDIFGIIGLIGTIFSVWGFFIMLREKRKTIYFTTRTQKILSLNSEIPNLTVNYCGKEVKCLTITTFAIWADKYTNITKNECSRKNPPKIVIEDPNEILHATTVQDDLDFTDGKVRVDQQKKTIYLSFRSITNTNGLCVKILHNAETTEMLTFEPMLNNVKCRYINHEFPLRFKILNIFNSIATFLLFSYFAYRCIRAFKYALGGYRSWIVAIGFMIAAIIFFFLMIVAIYFITPVVPKFIRKILEQ